MGLLKRLLSTFRRARDDSAPRRRAVMERLDSRVLLTDPPSVTDWDFLFQQAQHALVVTFNQNVSASLVATDARVDQVTTNDPDPVPTSLSYDSGTNTATFTFPGVLDDGHYRAVIAKEDIQNVFGQSMIADKIMDFSFLMCDIRLGDGNPGQDGYVNLKDWNAFAANYNGTGPWTYMDGDFNYDGVRSLADFNILAARFGNELPPRITGPGMVSVSVIGATNTLNLNWQDSNPDATGYRIQRSTDGQNFSIYHDLLPPYQYSEPPDGESTGTITWTDDEVLDGTRYWYRVRAFGNGQDTAYTPKKAATTTLPRRPI